MYLVELIIDWWLFLAGDECHRIMNECKSDILAEIKGRNAGKVDKSKSLPAIQSLMRAGNLLVWIITGFADQLIVRMMLTYV